jgi:hypothetical protein
VSAHAECSFCPSTVQLSEDLAQCYVGRLDEETARASGSGLPFHLVNLLDCLEDSTDRNVGGQMPDPRKPEVTKIDTTFLIETANLGCLAKKIVRSIDNGAYEDTVVVTYEVADVCTD